MVNTFSAFDFEQTHSNYITLPFFYGGKPASASFSADDVPVCVMSLAAAGSLRYNSGLENPPRQKFLKEVLPEGTVSVPVYLVHSKRVFVAEPDAGFPGGVGLVPPDENFTDGVSLVVPLLKKSGKRKINLIKRMSPCRTLKEMVLFWKKRLLILMNKKFL